MTSDRLASSRIRTNMNESGLITKYIHRRARQNIYIHLPIGEWGGGGGCRVGGGGGYGGG